MAVAPFDLDTPSWTGYTRSMRSQW